MARYSLSGIVYSDPLAQGKPIAVDVSTECYAEFDAARQSVFNFPAYSVAAVAQEGQLIARRQFQRMPKIV